MQLILASQSKTRLALFQQAKIPVETQLARIDEGAITQSLLAEGASPRDIVDTLAEMKARKVSNKNPKALVLGCDQILMVKGQIYGKPASKGDLKTLLQRLGTTPHQLLTANVLYQDGKPLWRHIGVVRLQFAQLADTEIDEYIETHWETVQYNAGGYGFEVMPHLFTDVKGSWFDIMGVSIPQIIGHLKTNSHIAVEHPMPKLAAVLGHPISHSKSPRLHGYWLEKHNIPGDYSAIDLPPEGFAQGVKSLIQAGFAGFNVTIPHKEAALALADTVSDTAKSIGAANTLYVGANGAITGHNTDAYGFIQNIRSAAPDWQPESGPALVLGAGGAARAVLWSLLDAGTPKILLTNRTRAKAETLASEFGDRVEVIDWDTKSGSVTRLSTLINTTALGMSGQPPLEIDLTNIDPSTVVNDIVYIPLKTDLLAKAEEQGCAVVDGLGMLLHQAVPGFQGWFGHDVDVDDGLRQRLLS